jgi:hypothetical protein
VPEGTTTRDGALTTQSLGDAVADELRRGRRPFAVVVGSATLRTTALGILGSLGQFDELVDVLPRVELDLALGTREWEIRQEDELHGTAPVREGQEVR